MWPFSWKGASGFAARCTAEEVTHGIDGASSGIGEETTRVLALHGVHVVMAVRNSDSGDQVREKIVKETPEAKIDVMKVDLSSMASIRSFASKYKSLDLPLNLLINNAGIMACPFTLSSDNIELQLQLIIWGKDSDLAKKLWEFSLTLTGEEESQMRLQSTVL